MEYLSALYVQDRDHLDEVPYVDLGEVQVIEIDDDDDVDRYIRDW
jgi:hypothetical protein